MFCFPAHMRMGESGEKTHLSLRTPARVERRPRDRLTCSRAHRRCPPRRRRRPPRARARRAPSAASSSASSSGSSSARRRWRPRRPRTPSRPAGLRACQGLDLGRTLLCSAVSAPYATEEKHTRRGSCLSRGLQIQHCVDEAAGFPHEAARPTLQMRDSRLRCADD
jgi:hypothetical protein